MSWPAAPLCAPRAAGPNLPILARGLRGCPGRASGGLDTWGPIFGGKSGFRALSPRAQKRTYSGALARTHSRDTGHEVGGQFRPNLFLKSSKKQVLWGILTGPPSKEPWTREWGFREAEEHGRSRRGKHEQIGGRPPRLEPECVSSSQSVHAVFGRSEQRSENTGGDRKRAQAHTGNVWGRETKEREAGTENTRKQQRNWEQNDRIAPEVQ